MSGSRVAFLRHCAQHRAHNGSSFPTPQALFPYQTYSAGTGLSGWDERITHIPAAAISALAFRTFSRCQAMTRSLYITLSSSL